MTVLIVESAAGTPLWPGRMCHAAGFVVRVESRVSRALAVAQQGGFDLILLDGRLVVGKRMEGEDTEWKDTEAEGCEMCRRLRAHGVRAVIVVIAGRDKCETKIGALDAGADDYLSAPLRETEFLARVRALVRLRYRESKALPLRVGDLRLDPATRVAQRGSDTIYLSATEYSLLALLMQNAGRPLTRNLILSHVWPPGFRGSDNMVDVYVGYLRRKIDRGRSPLIHTVRGVGYRIGL